MFFILRRLKIDFASLAFQVFFIRFKPVLGEGPSTKGLRRYTWNLENIFSILLFYSLGFRNTINDNYCTAVVKLIQLKK